MTRTTSFVLGDRLEDFIAAQIRSGRYASASEVVRDGLRLVEERQRRIDALNRAIDEGLASGVSEDFSWDRVRARGAAAAAPGHLGLGHPDRDGGPEPA